MYIDLTCAGCGGPLTTPKLQVGDAVIHAAVKPCPVCRHDAVEEYRNRRLAKQEEQANENH